MRVGFVVLNYRNYRDTIECVHALERQDYGEFDIVIVDNGSGNGSEAALRKEFPQHTVVQSGANLGYAAGNNVGLRHVLAGDAEFAVVLNNDTIVEPQFLTQMVEYMSANPEAGLVGAMIMYDGKPDRMSARKIPPLMAIFWNHGPGRWFGEHRKLRNRSYYEGFETFSEPTEVEVISGACMMMRRSLLETIGLMDEATFLFWEEFILAERIRRSSFKTVFVPSVRVVHKGGRSTKAIPTATSLACLSSLNYYLKRYRDVGALRRYLTITGPALYFVPGMIKTFTGLRRQSK